MKNESKGRAKKSGLDKHKTKFEKKEKKNGGEEEKEKNMDAIKVKCAQVLLCGATRVKQKEVRARSCGRVVLKAKAWLSSCCWL